MSEEPALPSPLADVLAEFEAVDRTLRAEMLIEYADRFEEVPAAVASRPFPERSRAPRCESEAYVFASDQPDGTLKLWFAVENPQALSGQPLEQVVRVPQDVVFRIFGRDLSMGKGQGLIGMLEVVQHEARMRLENRRRTQQGQGG
jgi:cysteine desulfuration protein SufE